MARQKVSHPSDRRQTRAMRRAQQTKRAKDSAQAAVNSKKKADPISKNVNSSNDNQLNIAQIPNDALKTSSSSSDPGLPHDSERISTPLTKRFTRASTAKAFSPSIASTPDTKFTPKLIMAVTPLQNRLRSAGRLNSSSSDAHQAPSPEALRLAELRRTEQMLLQERARVEELDEIHAQLKKKLRKHEAALEHKNQLITSYRQQSQKIEQRESDARVTLERNFQRMIQFIDDNEEYKKFLNAMLKKNVEDQRVAKDSMPFIATEREVILKGELMQQRKRYATTKSELNREEAVVEELRKEKDIKTDHLLNVSNLHFKEYLSILDDRWTQERVRRMTERLKSKAMNFREEATLSMESFEDFYQTLNHCHQQHLANLGKESDDSDGGEEQLSDSNGDDPLSEREKKYWADILRLKYEVNSMRLQMDFICEESCNLKEQIKMLDQHIQKAEEDNVLPPKDKAPQGVTQYDAVPVDVRLQQLPRPAEYNVVGKYVYGDALMNLCLSIAINQMVDGVRKNKHSLYPPGLLDKVFTKNMDVCGGKGDAIKSRITQATTYHNGILWITRRNTPDSKWDRGVSVIDVRSLIVKECDCTEIQPDSGFEEVFKHAYEKSKCAICSINPNSLHLLSSLIHEIGTNRTSSRPTQTNGLIRSVTPTSVTFCNKRNAAMTVTSCPAELKTPLPIRIGPNQEATAEVKKWTIPVNRLMEVIFESETEEIVEYIGVI